MKIEQQAHSIVVAGSMNPTIFHPLWFAREGLIPDVEASEAAIEIIHPDVAGFKTEWLEIQVTRDRFIAKTKMDAYFEPLRDLVFSTFQILTHAPVKAIGINFEFHVSMRPEKRKKLIDYLNNDVFWSALNVAPNFEALIVRLDKEDDRYEERYLRAKIQYSPLLRSDGLFFDLNHHLQLVKEIEDFHKFNRMNLPTDKDWKTIKQEAYDFTKKITQ
jgi:hypothetical protein